MHPAIALMFADLQTASKQVQAAKEYLMLYEKEENEIVKSNYLAACYELSSLARGFLEIVQGKYMEVKEERAARGYFYTKRIVMSEGERREALYGKKRVVHPSFPSAAMRGHV